MKSTAIIRAIYDLWKVDPVLSQYTLRSTRIHPGVTKPLPYALIEAEHIEHQLHSGANVIAKYNVLITFYVGQDKTLANTLSDKLEDLIDYKLTLPIDLAEGCYVMGVYPDAENPILDKDDDLYGRDVNVVKQNWTILLNETRSNS